ncbi:MAG: twin-arginine translocation signal domain-containing protein [Alphaproteobacteria bacterium]|nr:MAG: twin-arginine translocation signal domain-containing protein [Alphaproteobacteria bacterium]
MKTDKRKAPPKAGTSRREVLKLAAVAPAAGAGVLVGAGRASADAGPATGRGYRETAHVRRYYESARF